MAKVQYPIQFSSTEDHSDFMLQLGLLHAKVSAARNERIPRHKILLALFKDAIKRHSRNDGADLVIE